MEADRELTKNSTGDLAGVSERQVYFTKFYDDLKSLADEVLAKQYDSYKEQFLALMDVLKIKPKIEEMPPVSMDPIILVEFNLEYDVVFMQPQRRVYKGIIQYFKDMLY